MPEPLTIQQAEVLDFIRTHATGDRFPTFRETAEALGLNSTGSVSDRFSTLARKGYIRRIRRGHWRFVKGVHSCEELLREVHESGSELPSGLHARINAYFGVRS